MTKQTVALIDYGSGNLHSAQKALERAARESEIDAQIALTSDPHVAARADRILLPGVGAFADCRRGIEAIDGMWQVLDDAVRVQAKPFLGICVGMQLMAERGLEFGETAGFGWIKGEVGPIQPNDPHLKIPHMGWNTIELTRNHPVFEGIATGANGLHAYFVHSFHLRAAEPADVLANTDYGGTVTAALARDTIVGTQFHPEKSQTLGLKLLANFLRWAP